MKNLLLESPVSEQDFIWVASYYDGTFFPEYSFDTKIENNFFDIDRNKLIRFGLVGYGMNMFFEVAGGTFFIVGRSFDIIYKDKKEDKDYYLTGLTLNQYRNIIQYKDAYANFDPLGRSDTIKSSIYQYNFGYEQTLNLDGVQFNFRAICCVPYQKPVYLNLRLSADKDFEDGILIIRRGGFTNVFELDAPLQANKIYEVNWSVMV